MLLTKISNYVECKKIYEFNKNNLNFNNISTHSQSVSKSTIFAISDNSNIKNQYIQEAIYNGAVAILTTKYIKNLKINQYVVNDFDLSIKILLNKLYPEKPQNIVAITGTNGKTSVTWYVSQLCLFNKVPLKTYGTLGFYINNKKKTETLLTTPNFEVLHQTAFSKLKNKYNFVFEASSHTIKQDRLKSLPINIAALTNVSHDHLDYHKNFKDYKKVKFDLFKKYLLQGGYSILNENIIGIQSLKKIINKKTDIISYGLKTSDIHLYNKKNDIIIKFFSKKYIIKFLNYSYIETQNIACAIACCYCLGIEISQIIKNLKKLNNPPGRLEKIKNKKNLKIFVDYAHTPEALKQVILNQTFNNIKPNILFGCGGNRDQNKRSKMGFIANKYANEVYITDDNPRDEKPEYIRKSIIRSCSRAVEIPNRKKAIFYAIKVLEKNKVLIIAGKGHEKYQIIKESKKNFDDVKIIKLALKK